MGSDADAFIEKAQSYSSKNVERYKGNELSSGDTVYHYTNFLGLAGILKSKSIRLDETTHMHDRSESNNFRDVCVENYKAGIFGASSIAHRDARKAWQVECFWNYIEEVFKLPAIVQVFPLNRACYPSGERTHLMVVYPLDSMQKSYGIWLLQLVSSLPGVSMTRYERTIRT